MNRNPEENGNGMPESEQPPDVTTLLGQIHAGDASAHERLARLVFKELRKIAVGHMRHERQDHTLTAGELVSELYLRLLKRAPLPYADRLHFYRIAAREMGRLLYDYGRARNGPERQRGLRIQVPDEILPGQAASEATVMIRSLLELLDREHPDLGDVVNLKFYIGLSTEEIARVLDIGHATVERRWAAARKWLIREVAGGLHAARTPPGARSGVSSV